MLIRPDVTVIRLDATLIRRKFDANPSSGKYWSASKASNTLHIIEVAQTAAGQFSGAKQDPILRQVHCQSGAYCSWTIQWHQTRPSLKTGPLSKFRCKVLEAFDASQ